MRKMLALFTVSATLSACQTKIVEPVDRAYLEAQPGPMVSLDHLGVGPREDRYPVPKSSAAVKKSKDYKPTELVKPPKLF